MGWAETALDEAVALAGDRRVALKVGAAWCSMCAALDREVLDTPAGASLFDGLSTVYADFDAPEARAIVRRLAILELPTLVVLDRGGEVGRVVGYESPAEWIARARVAIAAADPQPALREAHANDPDDAEAAIALGEALLSRSPEEGLDILERVSLGDTAEAAHALWLLGRYQQRVREDPETARWIWQQLGARFPDDPHASDAWWWYARAQSARGRPDLGAAAYEALARAAPDDATILADWARFCSREGYEPARARIRAQAMKALATARGGARDEIEALVMKLSAPFRRPS